MVKRKLVGRDDGGEAKQRFIDAARKLGADETGEAFQRAFQRAIPQRKPGDPPVKPDKGQSEDGADPKRKTTEEQG